MPTGVDIDNTLAQTDSYALYLLNQQFATKYRREQCTDYHIESALKLPFQQREFLRSLFDDPAFYRSLPPLRFASQGMNDLAEVDEVYYVTARDQKQADVTVEWLSVWGFPVGELRMGVSDKAKLAREEHLEAFIEDCPHHALSIAQCGIPVYLVRCPWNRHVKHSLITLVQDWAELCSIIQGEL